MSSVGRQSEGPNPGGRLESLSGGETASSTGELRKRISQ